MRDPIDELSALDAEVTPSPPAEIRRRGDRLRRRNHAIAGAGVVAAVVLIAVPLAVLGAQRADDGPEPAPPAPSPTETAPSEAEKSWPTVVPDEFPLTRGMPEGTGEGEELTRPGRDVTTMSGSGVELYACGSSAGEVETVDRLTTRITGPANGHARELRLFADDEAASTYVDLLRSHYEACPVDDQNGAPPSVETSVRDGALGEQSLDIRRTFDGAGRVAITVVRVGNAVLVENVSDEGSDVDALVTAARENLADVVAAMRELDD